MKRQWPAAFLILALTVACAAKEPVATLTAQPTAPNKGGCGDGVCSGLGDLRHRQ